MFGLCCYTSDTGQAEVAIWNMVRGLSPNHRNGKRHRAWTFCLCREKPGKLHTTKMGSLTLVLITHFAAEIMLITFLSRGCERPSSGFECHFTADVAECIWWFYALSWHINGGTSNMYFWDNNTLSSGQQPAEDCESHVYDTWLFHCYNMSRLPPTGPQLLTYVDLCFHIVWCNVKGVGDREILEICLNSASKITAETDIFPHGMKSLLTSVICYLLFYSILLD